MFQIANGFNNFTLKETDPEIMPIKHINFFFQTQFSLKTGHIGLMLIKNGHMSFLFCRVPFIIAVFH